eukprot:510550-Hanusia_phi.AAC.1
MKLNFDQHVMEIMCNETGRNTLVEIHTCDAVTQWGRNCNEHGDMRVAWPGTRGNPVRSIPDRPSISN